MAGTNGLYDAVFVRKVNDSNCRGQLHPYRPRRSGRSPRTNAPGARNERHQLVRRRHAAHLVEEIQPQDDVIAYGKIGGLDKSEPPPSLCKANVRARPKNGALSPGDHSRDLSGVNVSADTR